MYTKKYEEVITFEEYIDYVDFHLTRSQEHFILFVDCFNTMIDIKNEYTQAYKKLVETTKSYKDVKTDGVFTFDLLKRVTQLERHSLVLEKQDLLFFLNNPEHFLNIALRISEKSYDYNTKQEVYTIDMKAFKDILYGEFHRYAEMMLKDVKRQQKSTIIKNQFITYEIDTDIEIDVNGEIYSDDVLVDHFLNGLTNIMGYIQPIERLGSGKFKSAANFKQFYITPQGINHTKKVNAEN